MKRKPKVLIIGSRSHIGGAEKMMYTLVKERKDVDYEVAFFYDCAFYGERLKEETTVHFLNFQLDKVKAVKGLHALLKRKDYDIVYCWGLKVNIFARVLGKISGQRNIIAAQRGVDNWRSKGHSMLDRLTSRFVRLYISNSEAGRRMLIDRERITADKVLTVKNCIDMSAYEKEYDRSQILQEFGVSTDQIVITTVANLRQIKGHIYLLEALHLLKSVHEQITVLLVGDGEAEQELKEYIKSSGLQTDVRFLGRRTDVPAILAASDVFVLPSLSEGLPNSVMEAMASGLPVVATDVGGVRELVTDNENGFVVEARDAQGLARGMERLILDKNLRETMGKKNFTKIKAEFTIEKMVSDTEKIFIDLLKSQS